jgi:hypothetical protein
MRHDVDALVGQADPDVAAAVGHQRRDRRFLRALGAEHESMASLCGS